MIYYILGLITSTIVFSVFLAALRVVSGQYLWVAVFSLTLLSGATTLVFLVGLVLRMVQTTRQRNQTSGRRSSAHGMLPPSSRQLTPPGRIPLPQSEFARHRIGQQDAPTEKTRQEITRDGEAIRRWLRGEIEKSAPKKTKPGTHQMPGFESIKRQ